MNAYSPYLLILLLSALILPCARGEAAEVGKIMLKEHLGVEFVPQVLHYTLTLEPGALRDVARCTLRDPAGAAMLAQCKALDAWEDGSVRHLRVAFISGLGKYETKQFALDDSGQAPKDDGALKLSREGDSLILSSPLVAARIPAQSQAYPGGGMSAQKVPPPVSQIRGKTRWYGSASLDSVQRVTERKVSVAEDGPIYKKVGIEYTFAGGEKYVVEVVLNRGEELVRVSEDFTLTFSEPTRAEFAFNLAPGLNPDRSVEKPVQRLGSVASTGSLWDLNPYRGDMFPITYDEDTTYGALTPWSAHPGQWVHFACYNSATPGGDMVGIINTAPERWDHIAYVSPGDSWKLVQNPHMFFTLRLVKNVDLTVGAADRSLTAHFRLLTGHREWAFFVSDAFPLTEEITEGTGANAVQKTYNSGPRTFFTQKTRDYLWNSLDRIKDYNLEWTPDPEAAYPHLYASQEEFTARVVRYNAWFGGAPLPLVEDPDVQARMKATLLATLDDLMERATTNPGPPHHVSAGIYMAANVADMVLGTGTLTPEEEVRVKARLAYVAYMMNWRGYWGPEMGYAGNPNMTSFCYDAVGLIGLLLRDHPQSDTWVRSCTSELDREMAHWTSSDGAWIESLHYVRAAWQEHTMLFATLKHMGVKDYYREPRAQKFFRYYMAMQTPPDPEFNGQRGITQIGNSYVFEPVPEFGYWAAGMVDVDPELAGNLMWMWRQEGFGTAEEMAGKKFVAYGAGPSMWWGAHTGLPGYHEVALLNPTVQPLAPTPSEGSPWLGFGATLSAHAGGPKETKLYLRTGSYYSHWDADQNSVVLWGKGAPLCLDHGYGEFQPWLHNRINVNHMNDMKLGEVTSFFAGRGAGFVQGEVTLDNLNKDEYPGVKVWPMQPEPLNGRSMTTLWTRRALLMKDEDPDGPNYVVIRDTVSGELPTEWCLWAYGTIDDFAATPIRAVGKFGVDLLVYLTDADKGQVNTATVEMPADRRKQTLIHLRRPAGRGVLAVLFPVMAGQEGPAVSTFAEGAGVKMQAEGRTDWVFLPERKGACTVEGITVSGSAAAFSQRGGAAYYWVERDTTLSAQGLTVRSSSPVELLVRDNTITGRLWARDAVPVVTLSGEMAGRVKVLTCGGDTREVAAENGTVTLRLPVGDTEFALELE